MSGIENMQGLFVTIGQYALYERDQRKKLNAKHPAELLQVRGLLKLKAMKAKIKTEFD
jgi:hypothetical protein